MRLLERDDSLLVVIDAQRRFAARAAGEEDASSSEAPTPTVVDRIAWLTRVAAVLGVPVVMTEEDPDRNGTTDPRILDAAAAGTPAPFRKPVFGLAAVEEIMEAVRQTGRRTMVLTGFETDVCVAQSALGLLDAGYRRGGRRRRDGLAGRDARARAAPDARRRGDRDPREGRVLRVGPVARGRAGVRA